MSRRPCAKILDIMERLSRMEAAPDRQELTQVQRTALSYLSRANRFSRAPSQIAEYLESTRGTISQTLKLLARKGLVLEKRNELDRRWISYQISPDGLSAIDRRGPVSKALEELNETELGTLETILENVTGNTLKHEAKRGFGVCRTCIHHRNDPDSGAFCSLLDEPLEPIETGQICHEHAAVK